MFASILFTALLALVPGIRTPSGNITCAPTPGALHCDIAHSGYGASLQTRCSAAPTRLDWHGFELARTRKGTVSCSGGILVVGRVRYRTLAYGKTWRSGPFICTSRTSGLTCRNAAGHGLFISRSAWRAW